MPRMPKRVKFRKEMRRVRDRKATKGNYVAFGDFGLQALAGCWMTARQLEAGRVASQHFLKRQGKIIMRVFPDKPISKKPHLEEAAGNPNGHRQGGRRVLGRAGPARHDDLRGRGRDRGHRQAGAGAGGDEDAGALPLRASARGGVMNKAPRHPGTKAGTLEREQARTNAVKVENTDEGR